MDAPVATWTFIRPAHDIAKTLKPTSIRFRRGIKRRATMALLESSSDDPATPSTAVWTCTISMRFERWVARRAHSVDVIVLCMRVLALFFLLSGAPTSSTPLWAWLPLLCTLVSTLLLAACAPTAHRRHRWWLLPCSCVAAGACSTLLLAPWLLSIGGALATTLVWVVQLETVLSNALLTVRCGDEPLIVCSNTCCVPRCHCRRVWQCSFAALSWHYPWHHGSVRPWLCRDAPLPV